jgi:hypothetical protein
MLGRRGSYLSTPAWSRGNQHSMKVEVSGSLPSRDSQRSWDGLWTPSPYPSYKPNTTPENRPPPCLYDNHPEIVRFSSGILIGTPESPYCRFFRPGPLFFVVSHGGEEISMAPEAAQRYGHQHPPTQTSQHIIFPANSISPSQKQSNPRSRWPPEHPR